MTKTGCKTTVLHLNPVDESACGPTDYSNWGDSSHSLPTEETLASHLSVIPGRLLASAYPASRDREEQRRITETLIIDHSIEVIVNLMGQKELSRFTPYEELMREYAQRGECCRSTHFHHSLTNLK